MHKVPEVPEDSILACGRAFTDTVYQNSTAAAGQLCGYAYAVQCHCYITCTPRPTGLRKGLRAIGAG